MTRKPEIPYEEVARLPLPGMAVPAQIAFSPNDAVVTYLYAPDGSLDRRLYVAPLGTEGAEPREVPISTGEGARSEDELSLAERLRRERTRETGLGITTAGWAQDADALLVPLADGLHVIRGLSTGAGEVTEHLVLSSERGEIEVAELSPDGTEVAFVREGDLYVAPATAAEAGGASRERRLTATAAEGLSNGLAEYVAAEEMDRHKGFWWSGDGRHLAYAEVDERHIAAYRIVHQADDGPGAPTYEEHRYPFAGGDNARVRLGVVPASGGETTWMDTGPPERYLARVHFGREDELVCEIEARDQLSLEVVSFDISTGKGRLLHREEHPIWINLHDDFRFVDAGAGLEAGYLWSSERSGFRHLELRDGKGALVDVLTEGPFAVDRLEGLSESPSLCYLSASPGNPTERHLYAVPLAGGEMRRLTPEAGTHDVVVDHAGRHFVDRHSSLEAPPKVTVRSTADGAVVSVLHDRRDPRTDELDLSPPRLLSFRTEDGTELWALWYEPEARPLGDPPPLAVHVYGGPCHQMVRNDWASTVAMRAQALARLGVGVLSVDNRGSARRGIDFEAPLKGRMGHVEVDDQVAGVRFAVASGMADPQRVAVFGWSYGGYMSLMCLARAGEVFKAAVAGAPVTSWDGYDTHYTERYMQTPASNPSGYEASSVLAEAGGIEGDLLVVHGMLDENVHFRHTARLVNRLLHGQKPHRLLVYPAERHLPRRLEDRAAMEAEVIAWLLEKLA